MLKKFMLSFSAVCLIGAAGSGCMLINVSDNSDRPAKTESRLPLLTLTATVAKMSAEDQKKISKSDEKECVIIRWKVVEKDRNSKKEDILAAPAIAMPFGMPGLVRMEKDYEPGYILTCQLDGRENTIEYSSGLLLQAVPTELDADTVKVEGTFLMSNGCSQLVFVPFSFQTKYDKQVMVFSNQFEKTAEKK